MESVSKQMSLDVFAMYEVFTLKQLPKLILTSEKVNLYCDTGRETCPARLQGLFLFRGIS